MPKQSSKARQLERDEVQAAYDTIEHVIRQSEGQPTPQKPEKNPAAVALGRLGGLKGGKARAERLSAKRKREIARAAAKARWKKK